MTEPMPGVDAVDTDPRTAELRDRLATVHRRITEATREAGRGEEPRLIVVSKFHPAADVVRLASLGVIDLGENRDQEAGAKAAELSNLDLRWHFIGQLQSNKAKSVVKYAHSVQSVDRVQLVTALAKAIERQQSETGRPDLECFIQVSLQDDGGEHRGGAAPADVGLLADSIADAAGLRLAGLMAVAPLGVPPEAAFERLAAISEELRRSHPGAGAISAGMSQDLEAAVRFGATHLRIGSDILGSRPPVG
ncbi:MULTISPECIES: YggS family pyridoxal phosphate-dependent enzyme [Arthrobacter]|uniref:Pyridoxal phosphate homeostasis protein n=1 Tax=Arthrobacter terricola TaxID=2547396 RepID=A0A4R5KA50_9MICC|nr:MULTISPECIES: YggS family pyridoxal phosphate-dependent enzyme [Arthrobacter]MBT8159367.1 YggS family pyridoxal phosphate-dependent enzyme [Arthrobacter sp. GN70]TDF91395.1 YggS family pyridoxal phosphate-dependent enzyme [Arthrobacter terricola]